MLLDDTFGGNGKQPNLEEFVFIEDNTKEMEKEEEIAVKMKSLVSCNQSEFDCKSDKELKLGYPERCHSHKNYNKEVKQMFNLFI